MEHPIFLSTTKLLLLLRDSLRREVADIRADVPGGRVRRIVRQDARTLQTDKVKGGIQMAKKAAKGAKKKAAKKK